MIWNMAPVLKEEDEKNESIPKMLCQMDNHLGNLLVFFIDIYIHMTLGNQFSAVKIVGILTFACVFCVACVNCVRWSNNGLYLASGGDDKLVMVWKRAAYVLT